jgi:hypothetical protein
LLLRKVKVFVNREDAVDVLVRVIDGVSEMVGVGQVVAGRCEWDVEHDELRDVGSEEARPIARRKRSFNAMFLIAEVVRL